MSLTPTNIILNLIFDPKTSIADIGAVKKALDDLSKGQKINSTTINENKQKYDDHSKKITANTASIKGNIDSMKVANATIIQTITNHIKQAKVVDESTKANHQHTRGMHELASSYYLAKNALNLFADSLRAFVDNPFIAASSEYEVHLRNFNSLAQQTEEQLKLTHQALSNMATDEQLAGMAELAKTLQHIESSNYHNAEALMILESSNRAAMAGLADLFKVADAGTSILKAYGYEASKINEINNINAKTVQYGKVTMDQLNSVLGTAISIAPEAGVAYEQVAAAIATITAQGVNASIAATEVNALMKGIFKPSEQGKELAASIGLELSAKNLADKGLYGMMMEIMDKTKQFGKDQSGIIARLLGDIREIRGLLKLATNDGKIYNEMLEHMTDGTDQVTLALKEHILEFAFINFKPFMKPIEKTANAQR